MLIKKLRQIVHGLDLLPILAEVDLGSEGSFVVTSMQFPSTVYNRTREGREALMVVNMFKNGTVHFRTLELEGEGREGYLHDV